MTRDPVLRRAAACGAVLALGLAAPASAYVRIDDFSDPQTLTLAGGEDLASSSVIAPNAIVGERDAVIERAAGAGAVTLDVDPGASERLFFENAVGTESTLMLVYDGADGDPLAIDPGGLGDVDLTELGTEDRFAIRVQSDQAIEVWFQIFDAGDPSGDTWSAGTVAVPSGPSLAWHELPLVDLVAAGPGGHADPTDTGAILVRVSGPAGLDVQIDEIRVPEPGAWTAGLAALAALTSLRRTRR